MAYDTVELGRSGGTDFFCLDELLRPDERAVRDRVRRFCDDEVIPVINGYWDRPPGVRPAPALTAPGVRAACASASP